MQGALWPMHLKPMSIWPSKSETLQTLLQKFLWEVGRSKVGLAPDHPVFCRQPCHKLACFFSEKNPKCCFDSHFLTNVSYIPKFVHTNFYIRSQYISRWNDKIVKSDWKCHKLACFFSEKNPKCCFDSHFLTNVSYIPKFVHTNFYIRSQYISRWNDKIVKSDWKCHKLACFFSEKNPKCCFDSHFLTNVSYTPKSVRIFI